MGSTSWKVAWVVLFGCMCFQQCSAAKYQPYEMVPFDETSPEGPFRECEITPGEAFGKDSAYKTGIFIIPTAVDDDSIRAKVPGPHLTSKGDRRHDHHRDSGEHDSNEQDDHDENDDGVLAVVTSTAATIADGNLCRVFHLSDDSVYEWSRGGRYRMQFTVTIESWNNGCFFVNNLDVPDAGEALSRACYINGRYREELSKGMKPSETKNATAGLTRSYNTVELVIVVYPGWDVKNLKFWWTRETNPAGDVTVIPSTTAAPLVVSEANQTATTGRGYETTTAASETTTAGAKLNGKARKKREARSDDGIGGRVVITPLLIGADEPEGGLLINVNRHCERIGNGDFGECPYSGCAHYSFFCDGHFNCANGRIGDYDESWLVCGWILRRVVLPMISLIVLTMAAIAAVCLLKKNSSWLARRRNGNDSLGFRSGTASRRCSIHPLPLDASSLETEEQRRRRLKEREATGTDVTDTRTRSLSAGSRVTVSEQTPDLMLAPAYEHPPDYQTAVTVPVHTAASQPSNLQNSVQT